MENDTMTTNETTKRIKSALKARSGKSWSVTHGTGTAYCWIYIRAAKTDWMSDAQCAELATLLGLDSVHPQGARVPASTTYHQEYIDRAEGRTPSVCGTPYWD